MVDDLSFTEPNRGQVVFIILFALKATTTLAACDEEILRRSERIAPAAWGLVRLTQRSRNIHKAITEWGVKDEDYMVGTPLLFGSLSGAHGILRLHIYTKYQKAPLRSGDKGSK